MAGGKQGKTKGAIAEIGQIDLLSEHCLHPHVYTMCTTHV